MSLFPITTVSTAILAGFVLCVLGAASGANTQSLDIGSQKQLFIDDHLIESTRALTKTLHSPVRHPDNPVLTGSKPWEGDFVYVDGRTNVFDEETQEFKMWYLATQKELLSGKVKYGYRVCYATSRDGVRWDKPNLGQVEWAGSRENNMLPPGETWMRRPNIIKDLRDPDPARRFKMHYVDVIGGKTAITKAYSADGVVWRRNGDGRPWFRDDHNANLLGWDSRTECYVTYVRVNRQGWTGVGRSTSRDFVDWTDPEPALFPEPADTGKSFRGLAAFSYEDLYLGLVWVFHNDHADAELAISRDGIQWQRVSRGTYFFPRGAEVAWDGAWILPVAPVVAANRLWFYYTGSKIPYVNRPTATAKDRMEEVRSIGLATLRMDGFVSLTANALGGELTTKPLRFSGRRLLLNFVSQASGGVRAEVQDGDGNPIRGVSLQDARESAGDEIAAVATWKTGSDLRELEGRTVRLRLVARNAELYSFRFAR